MEGFLGPLLWLVFIVALIPVALWLLKRSPVGGGGTGLAGRSVGVLPLSGTHRIVTVEVGTGEDRRWLVLGVTPSAIQTLHVLPAQGEPAAPGPAVPPFGEMLARLRGRGAGDAAR